MMKVPKRLVGAPSPSHARARVQEKEIAAATGGRQTPGSGNQKVKGDVRVKGFMRIEAKTTKHMSFTVTAEHISKIRNSVTATGELPCMVIELGDGTTFMVLPEYALADVLENLRCS